MKSLSLSTGVPCSNSGAARDASASALQGCATALMVEAANSLPSASACVPTTKHPTHEPHVPREPTSTAIANQRSQRLPLSGDPAGSSNGVPPWSGSVLTSIHEAAGGPHNPGLSGEAPCEARPRPLQPHCWAARRARHSVTAVHSATGSYSLSSPALFATARRAALSFNPFRASLLTTESWRRPSGPSL